MPGRILPIRRKTRRGRPAEFVLADPRWDFAALLNVTADGMIRNAAQPVGKKHRARPTTFSGIVPITAAGFPGNVGSLGRGAGAVQSNGYLGGEGEVNNVLSAASDEYTMIAVVENDYWYYAGQVDATVFSVSGCSVFVAYVPTASNYTLIDVHASGQYRQSGMSPYTRGIPYLVAVRCVAGQEIVVSSQPLGRPMDWMGVSVTAESLNIPSSTRAMRLGDFPGTVYLGGLSTRALTDAELMEISCNLGTLFEPEYDFFAFSSGGFVEGAKRGLSSVHSATAATRAMSVAHHPRFAISSDAEVYGHGQLVRAAAFAILSGNHVSLVDASRRIARAVTSILSKTNIVLTKRDTQLLRFALLSASELGIDPLPIQSRLAAVSSASNTVFFGKRIAVARCGIVSESDFSVTGADLRPSSAAIVGESVLVAPARRIASARFFIDTQSVVGAASQLTAKHQAGRASVLDASPSVRVMTEGKEARCLT